MCIRAGKRSPQIFKGSKVQQTLKGSNALIITKGFMIVFLIMAIVSAYTSCANDARVLCSLLTKTIWLATIVETLKCPIKYTRKTSF